MNALRKASLFPDASKGKLPSIIGFDIGATTTRICLYHDNNFVELVHPKGTRLQGIGGQSLRLEDKYTYVLATPSKYLYWKNRRKIPTTRALQHLLMDRLVALAQFVVNAYPNLAICIAGISFAGPVNKKDNLIESAPNIWGPGSLNVRQLEEKIRKKTAVTRITLVGDDEAAGYRYLNQPQYIRNKTELHYLTISSGHSSVKIHPHTQKLIPYESGHFQVIFDPTDPLFLPCNCGGKGHLETLVSGRGAERLVSVLAVLPRYYQDFESSPLAYKNINKITTFDIVAASKQGDKFALKVVEISASYLAKHIASAILKKAKDINHLGIIINGGYARALGSELYLEKVKFELKKIILENPIGNFSVEKVNKLLVMGIDDANDSLHGAVLLAKATNDLSL
jgi:predicted NBD/HSP70 family sugar kinase